MEYGTSGINKDNHMRNIDSLQREFTAQPISAFGQQYNLCYGPEESNYNMNACQGGPFRTGINIRTRQRENLPRIENMGSQGSAARRIRLQKPLHVGSSDHGKSRYVNHEEKKLERKQTLAKVRV